MHDDALAGLWDRIKGLGKSAEGGLDSLWEHLKSGHAKAEAALPKPMQKIGEAVGAIGGDIADIGRGLIETAKIPGEVYQRGVPGSPEMESQAREFATTFGAGAAPVGSAAAGGLIRYGERGAGREPPRVPPPPERPALPPSERPPTEPEGGMPTVTTAEPLEPSKPTTLKESPETIADRLGAMRWTQDVLGKLQTNASADRAEFIKQYADKVSGQLSANEKLQIEENLEWHPGLPQAKVLQPHAQRILDEVILPSQARARADWKYLQENTDLDPELVAKMEGENAGYMHRIAISPSKFNPGGPFSPFGGERSLNQSTRSMKARQFYTLQRGNERVFMRGEKPADYGAKVRDDQRREWEIKRATIPEVEANTDVRYLHDPVLATLQNEQQLRFARRNVEALKGQILPEMERRGLGSTDAATQRTMGFRPTDIPALRGHYFEARTAAALNDFYRTPNVLQLDEGGHGPLTMFGNLNRFMVNMMFVNPLGHMRNVLSDYMLARSGIWGAGDGTFAPHMRAAWSDVYNKSPLYKQTLRAGGNLLGMDASNRVAWSSLMRRVTDEMRRDPQVDRIFKDTPWRSGENFAQSIWNQTQRAMWGFHDLMIMAQIRALQAKGLPLQEAIPQAEKYIANYRVPASIGEGGKLHVSPVTARRLSRFMQDRTLSVFGRYHYNKLAALGRVANEGWRALQSDSGLSPAQRTEALSRAGYLLAVSSLVPALVDAVLQETTGNPEAHMNMPGAAGTTARMFKAGEQMLRAQNGEAWYEAKNALAGIITPVPAGSELIDQALNEDIFTGAPIASRNLSAGQQITQRLGHAGAQALSPLRDIGRDVQMFRSGGKAGGDPLVTGISTPNPDAAARSRRGPRTYVIRGERKRFQRDYPWYPQ